MTRGPTQCMHPNRQTVSPIVGCLIRSEDARTVRDAFSYLAARAGRRDSYAVVESKIHTRGPIIGTNALATEHTQFMISGPPDRPDRVFAEVRRAVRRRLDATDDVLWWDSTLASDVVLLPVDRHLVIYVVEELRRGLSYGFPNMMIAAMLNCILIHGIDAGLLPGLLQQRASLPTSMD